MGEYHRRSARYGNTVLLVFFHSVVYRVTSAGLPLGVTFSFLISSPMVDLGSLVLLMSIFGWKVAVLYVIFGLVIAVAGGTLIEKLHLDNQVEEYIRNGHSIDVPQEELHFKDRMKFAWEQVVETLKRLLLMF